MFFMRFLLTILFFTNACYLWAEDSLHLTLYSNGQTQVQNYLKRFLASGQQTLSLDNVAQQLDPSSVFLQVLGNDKFTVLSQSYRPALNAQSFLTALEGKNVTLFLTDQKKLQGKLISASGDLLIQTEDGTQNFVSRTSLLRLEAANDQEESKNAMLQWQIQNKKAQNFSLSLSYLTGGLSWQAHYFAVLNQQQDSAEILCNIQVSNFSAASFKNAELVFVSGDVEVAAPAPGMLKRASAFYQVEDRQSFEVSSVFEQYHYKLNGRLTLADQEHKIVPFWGPEKIELKKSYRYNPQKDSQKVYVYFEQKDKKINQALPAGDLTIYQYNQDKMLSLVAKSSLPNLPLLKKIEFQTVSSFDLQAQRNVLESVQLGKRAQLEKVQVEISNSKDEDVIVEIQETFGQYWKVKESNIPAQKKDATSAVFSLPVKKQSSAILEYTVEKRW